MRLKGLMQRVFGSSKTPAAPRPSNFERLENRQLLAAASLSGYGLVELVGSRLDITGNSSTTSVYVSVDGNEVDVKINGKTKSFSKTSVKSLYIVGGNGAERLDVTQSLAIPTTIIGNGGNDTIYGGSGNDSIRGGDGHDHILGRDGNDTLWGDAGNDSISGGAGTDKSDGGSGTDYITASEGETAKETSASTASSAVPGYYDGINVTGGADASAVIPKLRALGIKGVRIWVGMETWGHRGNGQAFDQAKKYKDAGFKVMMNVGVVATASESTYRGFFQWLKRQRNQSSVDMYQIGNEPNHYKSWAGGLDGYMKLLKVAWSELHPTGAKILGAGCTSDVNAVKELINKGYLNYVDYAGFHPYGHSAAQVIDKLKTVKAMVGSKPLIVSEWNVRSQQDGSDWANEVKLIRRDIAKYCNAAYYFALKEGTTMAGPAGIFKSVTTWEKNQPYYDAVASFQYMEGGAKK